MELDTLPAHLIVIGGGYAGLELAQAYRRFGSDVTVIESGPQLMGREDFDVSQEMRRILSDEGIRVFVAAELFRVRGKSGERVSLDVRTSSGEQTIEGSDILVAAGRMPNTAGIGLAEAGVELDGRGFIRVNERLETSAADVWALGECAGSPMFTHISEDDFRIVSDNLAGGRRSTRDRLVPYCMFTDPPLAHVGLSEGEAERQGIIARVARLPTSAVLRAQATGEKQGIMKALVGDSDDRILGFTMIGAEAGEVMAVVQMAMLADLPYTRLRDAVLAHPTMAEGLGFLFCERAASVPVTFSIDVHGVTNRCRYRHPLFQNAASRRFLVLGASDRSFEIIAEDARLLRGAAAGGEDDERGDGIEPILGQKLDQRAGSEFVPAHPERRNRDAETGCRTGDEPRA